MTSAPPEEPAGVRLHAEAELNEFDFHQRLRRTPGISIVFFSSPGCGACRRLEQLLPALLGETPARLYKVNVQQDTALARAYEIFHLPSLLVFVDGDYHGQLHAEPRPEPFRRALQALLASPGQEEP